MATLLTVSKAAAEKAIPGRYIITLKEGVSLAAHVSSTQTTFESTPSNVTHKFGIINGYAGEFTEEDLEGLRSHEEIASIEEDSIVQTCINTVITQFVPPTYPSKLAEL